MKPGAFMKGSNFFTGSKASKASYALLEKRRHNAKCPQGTPVGGETLRDTDRLAERYFTDSISGADRHACGL